MPSAITVHIPDLTRDFRYFAFLVDSVDLTKVGRTIYDGKDKEVEFIQFFHAGMYGFTNKEARLRFINAANGARGIEIAYLAQLHQPATAPVAQSEKD